MATTPTTTLPLAALPRGSALRGGRSVVGSGAGPVAIAAGASVEIEIPIVEECQLGHLIVQETSGDLDSLTIESINLDNDEMINGNLPARMFAQDTVNRPPFGHTVAKNSTVIVTVKNHSSGSLNVAVGFTAL